MYKSIQDRKAWLFHKILVRLEGIKDFIKSISTSQGFIVVKTLSGELRFRAPLTPEDIQDLRRKLNIPAKRA